MSNWNPTRRTGKQRRDVMGVDECGHQSCYDPLAEDILDGEPDYKIIQRERTMHRRLHDEESDE